ncbi:MAG: ParB N-terminal domain-containing protein [Planctomycetes bacterium]|nr:ParB N-terminal domain-containing protein [Planctomycetota bacterium]
MIAEFGRAGRSGDFDDFTPKSHKSRAATEWDNLADILVTPTSIFPDKYDEKATKNAIKASDQKQVEVLGGGDVESQIIQAPLAKIRMWRNQPRTANLSQICERTVEEEQAILLKEHKTCDLTRQVAENHGVPEAITVIANDEGGFSLIDGHRRYMAISILSGFIPVPKDWPKKVRLEIESILADHPFPKTIPAKVLINITDEQVENLLAIKHSSGQLKWDALQRGRFAYNMLATRTSMDLTCKSVGDLRRVWKELTEKDQDVLKSVAHTCGKRFDKLRHNIMAFVATSLHCQRYNVKDHEGLFTYFEKFYNKTWARKLAAGEKYKYKIKDENKKIVGEVTIDPDLGIEEKFMGWVATNKVFDCGHVDQLHKIIANPQLHEAFLQSGYKGALEKKAELRAKNGHKALDVVTNEILAFKATDLRKPENSEVRGRLKKLKGAILMLESDLGESV